MRQVVVTGGGTGIGLAIAGEFVRAGDQVTITGRREGVLKEAVTVLRALAEGAAGHSGTGATADRTTALAARASTTARPAKANTTASAVGYVCFDASDPEAVAAALGQLPERSTCWSTTRAGTRTSTASRSAGPRPIRPGRPRGPAGQP